MKFDLPFSDATITSLVGKTVVLSDNHRNEAMFKPFKVIQVKGGGDFIGGNLEVQNGVLRIMEKQGLFCEFSGIETRNGSVFAVGASAHTISRDGHHRIIMHEMVPMVKADLGVCISSHIMYSKVTLPLLLESIRKTGFDMSKVVVVVGGYAGEKEETVEGAKVIYQQKEGYSLGGLVGTSDVAPYWLMIHDTSEADRNFLAAVDSIDLGLSPDLIRLSPNPEDFVGFYKTEFINRIRSEITINPNKANDLIRQWAKIVTTVPGKTVEAGEKDVYGKGNIRRIEKSPIGLRKYRSVSGRRTP